MRAVLLPTERRRSRLGSMMTRNLKTRHTASATTIGVDGPAGEGGGPHRAGWVCPICTSEFLDRGIVFRGLAGPDHYMFGSLVDGLGVGDDTIRMFRSWAYREGVRLVKIMSREHRRASDRVSRICPYDALKEGVAKDGPCTMGQYVVYRDDGGAGSYPPLSGGLRSAIGFRPDLKRRPWTISGGTLPKRGKS